MGQISEYMIWHTNTFGTNPTSTDEMDVDGFLKDRDSSKEKIASWNSSDLESPAILKEFKLYSPSAQLILDIKNQNMNIEDIHWREFEEIVAELLKSQGWDIELGRGTKDKGVDILAEKDIPSIGVIRTIWQAKHFASHRKVGVKEIRELHSVVLDNKVNKGVMVTSTFLTRGAIERIDRDKFLLGGAQKPNILKWIEGY